MTEMMSRVDDTEDTTPAAPIAGLDGLDLLAVGVIGQVRRYRVGSIVHGLQVTVALVIESFDVKVEDLRDR